MYDMGRGEYDKKNCPFKNILCPPPLPVVNNATFAIKQTVSLLRERINAD